MSPTPLQIKVKALQRLIKEESLYKKEVSDQETHVSKMEQDGADEYEIKKQIAVLDESKRMIPILVSKIAEQKRLLNDFLQSYTGDEDTSLALSLT